MISIDVTGIEELARTFSSLISAELKDQIFSIVDDELYTYSKLLYMDPSIPKEYKQSLTSVIIRELDTVVLIAYGEEQLLKHQKKWGRIEWAIYRCPKRKYFGGELTPEYSGPDYLYDHWKAYQNTFISNVTSRIVRAIRGE